MVLIGSNCILAAVHLLVTYCARVTPAHIIVIGERYARRCTCKLRFLRANRIRVNAPRGKCWSEYEGTKTCFDIYDGISGIFSVLRTHSNTFPISVIRFFNASLFFLLFIRTYRSRSRITNARIFSLSGSFDVSMQEFVKYSFVRFESV